MLKNKETIKLYLILSIEASEIILPIIDKIIRDIIKINANLIEPNILTAGFIYKL